MNAAWSVAVAAVFVWLGMVVAISFLEAPLKFRAPGITLPLGLGIGRLVFRALNVCEAVLAAVILVALFLRRAVRRRSRRRHWRRSPRSWSRCWWCAAP